MLKYFKKQEPNMFFDLHLAYFEASGSIEKTQIRPWVKKLRLMFQSN